MRCHHHAFLGGYLHLFLQIEPYGYLAPVEWLLLDDAGGHIGLVRHEWLLIGAVGQEVSLHDTLCSFHAVCLQQFFLSLVQTFHLSGKQVPAWFHVHHHVPLL